LYPAVQIIISHMQSTLAVDLHRIARLVHVAIPLSALAFLAAGTYVSFYFHYLSVAFLFLALADFSYRRVQTQHALLRNFGVLGQLRYLLESVGPEFRQYFFANDTEERPFSRVERSEVYRKAHGIDSASSFGSQTAFDVTEIKLRHSMFPVRKENLQPFALTFGEERGLSSAYTIRRHMLISGMSYGALSENAVRALARGAKLAGIAMNTGEGGYPLHHLAEGPDLIFQMGTGKFGVRRDDGALDEDKLSEVARQDAVKMIEIKLSQGAKPGKGGMLPKEKLTEEISRLRGVPLGHDVISPSGHAECEDPASTVTFIRRVQDVSGLPVGIKLCIGSWREFRALVDAMLSADTFPDYISIDGGEGGTGAAPRTFMDDLGLPLWPALRGVHEGLLAAGVRDRLKLLAAGKLITPGRQITALALGADAIYTARGFLLALGCIQALQCSQNTCPAGITTHDPSLTRGLVVAEKAQRVKNYADALDHEFAELLGALGCRSTSELTCDHLFIPAGSILSGRAPTAESLGESSPLTMNPSIVSS
jgi:glutamate synthase domain-containing protein 2